MPVAAMAKPGTRVSAGKVLLRVDNVSSSEVYMSLFGPDGVASKVEPLPIDVWKRYRLGRTEFYVKATTDGAGKDVFFSFLF